jgi:hypothetical protein
METIALLPYSQEPATGPYIESRTEVQILTN